MAIQEELGGRSTKKLNKCVNKKKKWNKEIGIAFEKNLKATANESIDVRLFCSA